MARSPPTDFVLDLIGAAAGHRRGQQAPTQHGTFAGAGAPPTLAVPAAGTGDPAPPAISVAGLGVDTRPVAARSQGGAGSAVRPAMDSSLAGLKQRPAQFVRSARQGVYTDRTEGSTNPSWCPTPTPPLLPASRLLAAGPRAGRPLRARHDPVELPGAPRTFVRGNLGQNPREKSGSLTRASRGPRP